MATENPKDLPECEAGTNAFSEADADCGVCGEKITRFSTDCSLEPPPTLKSLQQSLVQDPPLPGFFSSSPTDSGNARVVRVRLDEKKAGPPHCNNQYIGKMWDENDNESNAIITNLAELDSYPCKNPSLPAYSYGVWRETSGSDDLVDVAIDIEDHWKIALVKIEAHTAKPGQYTGIQVTGYYDPAQGEIDNNWDLAGPPPDLSESDANCTCPVTIVNLAEIYLTDSTHGLQCGTYHFGVILNKTQDPEDERYVAVNMQIDESFWAEISSPHENYPWTNLTDQSPPHAYTFEEVDFEDDGTEVGVAAPRTGDCYEVNNNLHVPSGQIVRIFRTQRPVNSGTAEEPNWQCEIVWAFLCDRRYDQQVVVKITGNHAGGGKYAGEILGAPTSDTATTGDLTEANIGDATGAVTCIAVNPAEVGQATHKLDAGTLAIGRVVRVSSTNVPIVVLAYSRETCVSVQVGEALSHGETYAGTLLGPPSASVAYGTLSALTLGEVGASGTDCIVVNAWGIGLTTHFIPDGRVHVGKQIGNASGGSRDGQPVIHVYDNPGLFVCNLTQTGGSDGTASANPSWTYTAQNTFTDTLGTGLSPEVGRTIGSHTAATKGLGYYVGTTFHLLQAFETPATIECGTSPPPPP